MTAIAIQPPQGAPGVFTRARWAVSDTLTISKRNLLVWARVPAYIVFTVIQPVMFVLLFAFAAFQSSPHCFITLCACTGPVDARARAPATKKAESAARKDVLIIVVPSYAGVPATSPGHLQPGESPGSCLLMPRFH